MSDTRSDQGHHVFAIILAGGEGTRLRELTTNAEGVAIPKQFCSFDGRRSMLQASIERAERVAASERVLVVVSEAHRKWWSEDLAAHRAENVIVQPSGRGTAPAILLGILEVLSRDRDATVYILPSDHCVTAEATLQCTVEEALRSVDARRERIVLLGMIPEWPEPSYGWILPAAEEDGSAHFVAAFVEKPDAETAAFLMERGALWNAFLVLGGVRSLVDLYRKALPGLTRTLARYFEESCDDRRALRVAYESLPTSDFSRDVLERFHDSLRLLAVAPCGWSDVGTPARVLRTLAREGRALATGDARAPRLDLVESVARAYGLSPAPEGGWKQEDFAIF